MMKYADVLQMTEELGLEVIESYKTNDEECYNDFFDQILYMKFNNGIMMAVKGEGLGVDLAFELSCNGGRYELRWPNDTDKENMSNDLIWPNDTDIENDWMINSSKSFRLYNMRTGNSTFFEGELKFFLLNCVRRMIS